MKKHLRLLAVLLCLSLLMSALPIREQSWTTVSAEEESEVSDIVIENEMPEAEELPAEVQEEPEAEELPPVDEIVDEGESGGSAEVETPQSEESEKIDRIPLDVYETYETGYVQIIAEETILRAGAEGDAEVVAYALRDGVGYALRREGSSLFVRIYDGESVAEGWIAAEDLRAVEAERELSSYFEACAGKNIWIGDGCTLLATAVRRVEIKAEETEQVEAVETEEIVTEETETEEKTEAEDATEVGEADDVDAPVEEAEETLIDKLLTPAEDPKLLTATAYGITDENFTLSVGMKRKLSLNLPQGLKGYEFGVTKNGSVIKVDSSGTVTAVATGTASVTIEKSGYSFEKSSVTITVVAAPTAVTCDVSSIKLGVGDIYELSDIFHVKPKSTPATMTYFGHNEDGGITPVYVTVEKSTGRMRALKKGEDQVQARTQNGKYITIKVNVCAAPTEMILSKSSLELGVDMSGTLGVSFEPSGAYSIYRFESDDPDILTINSKTGSYRAVSTGTATISVYAKNGDMVRTCPVTVLPAPTEIFYDSPSILGLGEKTYSVKAHCSEGAKCSYAYKSSDTKVLKVSSSGKLTTVKAGTAKITVYDKNHTSVKASCTVKVTAAPKSVTAKASVIKLGVGNSFDLLSEKFFGVKPSGSVTTFKFLSEDTSLFTVDASTGVINALKTGKVSSTGAYPRLKATTHNGKSKLVTVHIYKNAKSVELTADKPTIGVNMKGSLSVSFPENSYDCYDFSVSGDDCIKLDSATATYTGTAPGHARITVTTVNGVTDYTDIEVLPAPTSEQLHFIEGAQTMGVKEKKRVVSAEADGDTMAEIAFKSSNTKYVKINATTGALTGVKKGSATITAYDKNNKSVYITCKVTVVSAPTSVSAKSTTLKLGVGNSYDLVENKFFTAKPAGSARSLTYASETTSVATVDASTGVVKAKATGKTRLRAKAYNGKYKLITLTVCPKPTSALTLTASAPTVGVGMSGKLSVGFPSGTYDTDLSYSASPEGILEIGADGSYTAVDTGDVTVTVSSKGGSKAKGSCVVSVLPAPTRGQISCSPESLSIGAGVTGRSVKGIYAEGTICDFIYESDAPDIVTVTSAGKVSAVSDAAGASANIIVRSASDPENVYVVCPVTVIPAPSSVKLKAARTTIGVGEKLQLTAELPEGTDATLTYKVTDGTSYASVTASGGIVTAKKVGTATVQVKTHNGKTASIKITVKKAPSSVKFNSSTYTLGVGESMTPKTTVTSGSVTTLSFESADPNIASIDPVTGEVTAYKQGSVKLTVKTHNGLSGKATLNIVPAPTGLTLYAPNIADSDSAESITMGVGLKTQLACKCTPSDAHFTPVYTIERNVPATQGDSVLLINSDGTIAANAPGTALVRASCYVEGVYDDLTVIVKKAPSSLTLEETAISLDVNDADSKAVYIRPIIDEGAYTQYTYSIATAGAFTIDGDGRIRPICKGGSKVTVKTHNGKSATCTVTIEDRYFPEKIAWGADMTAEARVLKKGETLTCTVDVTPSTAVAELSWSSSDTSVATVGATTGKVTAVGYGTATIKAVSKRNKELVLTTKITVPLEGRSVTMPVCATTVTESQISGVVNTCNKRAQNIYDSAVAELDELVGAGKISSSVSSKRKAILQRAFKMLDFAWTTTKQVPYWSSSYDNVKNKINKKLHSKDYFTSTLYYGLPYTQTARGYNNENIVSGGYYSSDKTNGRRKFNTSKDVFSRNYKGNDCSSFVSMAVKGLSASRLNTKQIASSSGYNYDNVTMKTLYPGDILVRSGHHVVMFLYYTNSAKTQFVVIEQGGSDDYNTNVVACRVKSASSYSNYKPGRPKF